MTDSMSLTNWGITQPSSEPLLDQLGLHGIATDREAPEAFLVTSPRAPQEEWALLFWVEGEAAPLGCFSLDVVRRAWEFGLWTQVVQADQLPRPAESVDERYKIFKLRDETDTFIPGEENIHLQGNYSERSGS